MKKQIKSSGDPLEDYTRTLRKMALVLRNTPPEKLDEFKQRFYTELAVLEALIEAGELPELQNSVYALNDLWNH